MKKLLLFLTLIVTSITLYSEEKSSEELLKQIEALEVELEKVKIEAIDNNPMALGQTKNWGQGLSLEMKMNGGKTEVSTALIYNFATKNNEKEFNSRDLIGTMGFGLLISTKTGENPIYISDKIEENNSETQVALKTGITWKMRTPILLNFISLSNSIVPFIQFPFDGESSYMEFGLDIGQTINFWVSENLVFNMGYIMDPTLYTIYGTGSLKNPVTPIITFGLEMFL